MSHHLESIHVLLGREACVFAIIVPAFDQEVRNIGVFQKIQIGQGEPDLESTEDENRGVVLTVRPYSAFFSLLSGLSPLYSVITSVIAANRSPVSN